MSVQLRADRAVFRFGGPDAHRLLNDVVTGRMPDRDDGVAQWWALLSPQGKILAEGLAGFAQGALWLDVHQSVADDFFKRMRLYRLRAKVDIDDLRATHRVGFSQNVEPGTVSHSDRLGVRLIAPVEETTGWMSDDSAYHSRRIAKGIAQLGPDFGPNDAFAHDIGMDQLDGIDFAKGCYVGQEVVSRMKHRGTARRRPVIAQGALPEGGVIMADGREAGTAGRPVDGSAVAIVRLDRITDPAAVTIGGQPGRLALPAWATYAFGETVPADD